jgi:transcription elongation GreA/GreB family factor
MVVSSLSRKQALRDELLRRLEADFETAVRAHEAACAGATDEEAKPENDKDTRALEQSYLARGQAQRVEELRLGIACVQAMPLRAFEADAPVALGALVTVEENDERHELFVAPHGGGTMLSGGSVRVVTPKSPLGHALVGRRAGDECQVRVGLQTREQEIVSVT